ncbi:Gram-negative bacterial tonB protein [Mariniflexile rhizosphaerae]|uniref:energy transducer TonB n=1 Tax=unclassified Mariniflexile TaxID=2643887 RepID=UPI000CC1BFEE|nr:energy transducer TonB [Mariniflexile sp. TRM1-10]AXP79500.1 Gram-negative bacterial tonB protein [Mariniflexile sp. TRM1-10]PLB19454.1 MAG: TonB family protein [Flavobacteriaceae bacterium FS1-H7996/R]
MKLKTLLVIALIFSFLAKSQNLNDKNLMGEWKAVNVDIPNSDEVPQKEALKLIEDAFLGSKFNFKGNKVFRIKYGKLGDERMKELFFLDNQNWIIKNDQILIGTENDGFSSMHITFQENSGKTYFILPMIRLEMEKLSDDKPSETKVIESKSEKIKSVDYSKAELVTKEIDESQIVEFNEVENPPLAPDCKSKWDIEKRKECTNKFIQQHVMRKFNTDLAADVELTGKIKIMIEFVIDTNGKPININAAGGPEIMNQNAIEVIGLLPNLEPGTKEGKPINVSYKMPLNFIIAD